MSDRDSEVIADWLNRNVPDRVPAAEADGADYLYKWAEHRRFGTEGGGETNLRRAKAGTKRRPGPMMGGGY